MTVLLDRPDAEHGPRPGRSMSSARVVPGLLVASAAAVAAYGLQRLVPGVGSLTWAVLLGALAANAGLGRLDAVLRPGYQLATKRLLRAGVVLLGLTLSVGTIGALGIRTLGLVVVVLFGTLFTTLLIGSRLGVAPARRLLVAVGFSICGASAIAAVEDGIDSEEEDVAAAVAMVTLYGSIAMLAIPLLQGPLGLTDHQTGVWAGASVHEVGQVVAAAQPAGAAAVAIAIVVKLTRVLLLAPVSAGISVWQRRTGDVSGRRAPLVPMFVIGFAVCVLLRTFHLVPEPLLAPLDLVRQLALAAGLFGLGTAVRLRRLLKGSGSTLLLGLASTLVAGCLGLAGVLLLG